MVEEILFFTLRIRMASMRLGIGKRRYTFKAFRQKRILIGKAYPCDRLDLTSGMPAGRLRLHGVAMDIGLSLSTGESWRGA